MARLLSPAADLVATPRKLFAMRNNAASHCVER